MKLSYNWLQDYIDLSDLELKDVAHRLTMGAFEVEDIETIGDQLEGEIVLGEIKEIAKHPDADKLQVTQTQIGFNEDGSENITQIVCGAANIAVGQKIPVATVGSLVVNRHDGTQLKIKKSKIRGVESCGMLCSGDELGLTEAAVKSIQAKQGDGIYVLFDVNNDAVENKAADHAIGTHIKTVLGLKEDYVLDVGARSNRGDALSVIGQARELAAVLSKELKKPGVIDINNFDQVELKPELTKTKPVIENEADCAVFFTCNVENLEVKESPEWLRERIENMGTKSINNIVDVSNYVLLEYGQPLHFYDLAKLAGNSLVARRAKAGEKITTLEEKEYVLDDKHFVIADEAKPECLAGAMGGMNSGVSDSTTQIVIEAAAFNAATVRKSARAAGVESESKRRFERGVDKANTKAAMLRAIELLAKVAAPEGQKIQIGEIQQAGSDEAAEVNVSLQLSNIRRVLGVDVDAATVETLLSKLDINKTCVDAGSLTFSIPSFRQADISREEDLIEEIGRLYGFDKIPAIAPDSNVTKAPIEKDTAIEDKVSSTFVSAGFSQAILSSLIGDTLAAVDRRKPHNFIKMDNPLSKEHSMLRDSLVPGLIQAASRNFAYNRNADIKLFELGKVYDYNPGADELNNEASSETPSIAAIFVVNESSWLSTKETQAESKFFYLKTIIEELFPRAEFIADTELRFTHPGIAAKIQQDRKEVGFLAKIHPSLAKEWDLPGSTYILELSLPKKVKKKFKAISNNPIITRDMTVDITKETQSSDIEKLIKKQASRELKSIELVSLYKPDPKQVEYSSSYRLTWQSENETLTGEVIDEQISKIKNLLEMELEVKFRA